MLRSPSIYSAERHLQSQVMGSLHTHCTSTVSIRSLISAASLGSVCLICRGSLWLWWFLLAHLTSIITQLLLCFPFGRETQAARCGRAKEINQVRVIQSQHWECNSCRSSQIWREVKSRRAPKVDSLLKLLKWPLSPGIWNIYPVLQLGLATTGFHWLSIRSKLSSKPSSLKPGSYSCGAQFLYKRIRIAFICAVMKFARLTGIRSSNSRRGRGGERALLCLLWWSHFSQI